MDISYLGRGIIIGLAIAAPVGPIGILCIRRTLAEGRVTGLVSGLGAATADACYGAVAALGLTAVSSRLVSQQDLIRLVGGLFICWLGLRIALSRPAADGMAANGSSLAKAYGSTFALTLANPTTILSFIAVFAGLGLAETEGDRLPALLLVLGVFLGSALWWLVLSGGVSLLRGKLTPSRLRWVNRVSGGLLVGFGLLAVGSLLR
jgi:threonine/homoserine/homoserine lactone efflux protein